MTRENYGPENGPEAVTIRLPRGALGGWNVLLRSLDDARRADGSGWSMVYQGLIDQIEAQMPTPRPTEPTGLGAVVEAACVHGSHRRPWTRDKDGNWHDLDDLRYRDTGKADDWDSLIEPDVKWEGVAS